MRATITIDDQLARELKEAAHRTGKPFKQVVNEALRAGLVTLEHPKTKPYRLKSATMGRPRIGVDPDKALRMADQLEEDAIIQKLEQRK